jgi:hypothetical protein
MGPESVYGLEENEGLTASERECFTLAGFLDENLGAQESTKKSDKSGKSPSSTAAGTSTNSEVMSLAKIATKAVSRTLAGMKQPVIIHRRGGRVETAQSFQIWQEKFLYFQGSGRVCKELLCGRSA